MTSTTLSFSYDADLNLLSFDSDEVVELLYRSVECSNIKSLEILSDDDFETFLPADDLLENYSTLYDIYIGETVQQLFGVNVISLDGTEFSCIFNFTKIKSACLTNLLHHTWPVFEHYGYSINYIKKLITMFPNQDITLEQTIKI